ncbi:MAG: hypothetical protein RL173_932 [Fibrobacterota bacterium]|jgi:hypothetical protein
MWREVAPWEGQSPTTITVDFQARMWRKPGASPLSLRTRQLNRFADPARYFFLEGSMMGIPLKGLHIYENAHASMLVRLAGLFTVAKAEGPCMDQGETVTLLNDMCLMAPGTLVDRRLSWKQLDARTVEVDFRNHTQRVTARMLFDEHGELVNFESNQRAALQADGSLKYFRWSTPIDGWQSIDGFRLPTMARTIYDYPDGPFIYGEFHLVAYRMNPSTPLI